MDAPLPSHAKRNNMKNAEISFELDLGLYFVAYTKLIFC